MTADTAPQPLDPALPSPLPPPAPGTPHIDPEALRSLGATLAARFNQYESDRRLAELKWERNARQYLGIYDPEIESRLDVNRSRAYPKLTRVKCVSMLSRLMNLLFQADDKNWTVSPSAVPDLDQEDLQGVLDKLMPPGSQQVPDDETIEQAIRDFARKRAERMETEIEDQLQDIGGSRLLDYVALCRKVLASGIQYGVGILKGPFLEEETRRRWQVANGKLQAVPYTAYRPRFEWVSVWDYYPDMSAKTLAQMDGQFQRYVFSRHQLIKLKDRQDFMADQIDRVLQTSPAGNYRRRAFETEIRAMGVQVNVTQAEHNKFEAVVWEGYVSGIELARVGVNVAEDKLASDVRAQIWVMGDTVIKADIDPWSLLEKGDEICQYHHFIFEEDESFLLGTGLPAIMRDSQLGVCAVTRMMLDNFAVQRNLEVNIGLLSLTTDVSAIMPDKIWYREDTDPGTANMPAVRAIEIPMNLEELTEIAKMFQGFADQETFVNPATGGDMQRGPSEPFRTATGASMLRGDAALPFKDVVRNFDVFTESVVNALLIFNRNYNQNPAIRGDFKAVARGATSLVAKEVLGAQLDNLATTLTDGERKYVKMRELLRARVRVRDLDAEDIVMNDVECDQVDANEQQMQQMQQEMANEQAKATIRDTLASALKSISQAGKNSAAAEATTANVILGALEKGVSPDAVQTPPAPAGATDGTNANDISIPGGLGGIGATAGAGGMPGNDGTGMGGTGPAGIAALSGNANGGYRPQAAAMPTQ